MSESRQKSRLLTGDWRVDQETGKLLLVDEQKIQNQKEVLAHMVKNLGSEMMKGKSLHQIKLPIQIFDSRTFLQTVAQSFAYAPVYLQQGSE